MNRIRNLLGIKYPIIMGGISRGGYGKLPAAVSEAGGLGLIGAGGMSLEAMIEQMSLTRSQTDNPWGVNIIAGAPSAEEKVALLVKEKPPVVSLGGILRTDAISPLKEAGIIVLAVVASIKQAKKCLKAGADAIVVEGVEAGGHVKEDGLTTMVFTRFAAKELNCPVISAGGIVDGETMAAALNLGADGVQAGTIFVCAEESPVHPAVKEAYIASNEKHGTVITGSRFKSRALRNALTKSYEERERESLKGDSSLSKIEGFEQSTLKLAMEEGNVTDGCVMAGQGVIMVKRVRSAAEIIAEMMAGCEKALAETLYRL